MRITWTGQRYEAISSYDERLVPKAAGFRWDPNSKRWYTQFDDTARKLAQYADATCAEKLGGIAKAKAESLEASRASTSDAVIPAPAGREYLPFQRAGIAYATARPSTLFGDEMGLGKTIQAIGTINADVSIKRVLIVCPASLRLNWKRELESWLVAPRQIEIAVGSELPITAEVLIINYDILARHASALRGVAWDLLCVDEAHYLKNGKAKRTVALLGKWDRDPAKVVPSIGARRKIFLTGTPIPNRPIEGWTIFHALAPDVFKSRSHYSRHFCGGHQARFGWDETGAANLGELQELLRSSIMVRRLKRDVLKELPAKRRQVIEISPNGAQAAVRAEMAATEGQGEECERLEAEALALKDGEHQDAYTAAVAALREAHKVMFESMSRVRRETAEAKVPYVIEHLESALEGGAKVVCFAHHKSVVEAIRSHFAESAGAVVLVGETPMAERQANVDRFQSDPACRLFIGSITAAGVGITLTASSHVVFAELDWVPGNVTQAEDRCHRIGQEEMVLVQHLVFDGSLDARMAKTIVRKQEQIEQALDRQDALPVLPELPAPAPKAERDAVVMDPAVLAKLLPGGYCLETLEGAKNALGFWVVTQSSRGFWFLGQRLGPYVERVGYVRPDGSVAGKAGIVQSILGRIAADPKTAALRYGRELGICSRCSAPLTNDASRAAGIGPICAAKAGW